MADPKKTWDPKKPLLRINSPTANAKSVNLTGNGHRMGTRRPNPAGPDSLGGILNPFTSNGTGPLDDFWSRGFIDRNVRRRLVAVIPSWVPTEGEVFGDDSPGNVEQECAGVLIRSFQTWTDAPPIQYHKWYDWNFMVVPDPEYDWIRGEVNTAPNMGFDPADPDKQIDPMAQAVVDKNAIEGEWDAGAIGAYNFPDDPNGTYRTGKPLGIAGNDCRSTGGPMYERDWAWPMADEYMWMVGRSIYDGGHENNQKCRSELHPVKAVATVRKEAFIFQKVDKDGKKTGTPVHKGKIPDGSGKVPDGLAIPAYQFLFFSTVHGGYFDWPDLKTKNGKPYEFIVDLPITPWEKGPEEVAIAASDKVKLNTIVLRDNELLQDFDHERFEGVTRGVKSKGSDANPTCELLPADPAFPRLRQVKISVGADCLQNEYYGVLLSLGWRDHAGMNIARVRKCEVKFTKLKVGNHPGLKDGDQKDRSYERWRIKGGVQGRWRQFNFDRNHPESVATVPPKITAGGTFDMAPPPPGFPEFLTFFLDEELPLRISAHGAELRPVDDIYFIPNRAVRVNEADTGLTDFFHGPSFVADERNLPGDADDADDTDRMNVEAFCKENLLPAPSWKPPAEAAFGLGPGDACLWENQIDVRPPRMERPTGTSSGPAINNGDTDAWRWQCMRPVGRAALRGFFNVMAVTRRDECRPLGMIDAFRGPPGEKNPFSLKDLKKSQTDDTIELTAFYSWELGHLAEMVEKKHDDAASINDTSRWDYKLVIQIKTTAQYK